MTDGADRLKATTSPSPRAVFGLPAYNHAHKLREALDSLLSQTERDFRLIVSDDCSSDETALIVKEYSSKDDRLVYRRTEARLGYIANARRCFKLARALYPSTEFFAWASDHDVWHPRWLETLIHALDDNPDAVIASPLAYRIAADGSIVSARMTRCMTVGEPRSFRRFSKTFDNISPGNMIYGLMRADAVEKAGVLPWQLLPDRLLLVLLSFYGTTVHVPEYLWYRRYAGLASIDRQIRASFLSSPPAHVRFPWWIGHTGYLFYHLVLFPRPDVPFGRVKGALYSVLYLLLSVRHVLMRKVIRYGHMAKRLLLYSYGKYLKRVRLVTKEAEEDGVDQASGGIDATLYQLRAGSIAPTCSTISCASAEQGIPSPANER
jgi:glycosyltransferase involved in cell wall biosynthesis